MEQFKNLYQLSKTLRFELKPIGKDGKQLTEEDSTKVFKEILKQDRKIKAAYDALKPVMDKLHEEVINTSLTSDEAKQIDFSEYFEEYKKGKAKKLDNYESSLRESLGKTFETSIKNYHITKIVKKADQEKPVFEIKKNVPIAKAEMVDYLLKKYEDNAELQNHLKEFKGFFGYFSGYNTNRSNYYEYKKEASTAVASRIVHENLPKFCDNAFQFERRKDEYTNALQYLKSNNRTTQIKDAETNKMIEAESITEEWFEISKFNKCLTQQGIDEYNKVIGHYNLLINLYNQSRKVEEKDFKKLSQFKPLFKQIGSGKRTLFEQIENDEQLIEKLLEINEAGKKYFTKQTDEFQITIYTLINWLKENKDWNGVYWSKIAMDKVSTKYFANWHSIKDRIQDVLQTGSKEDKGSLKSVASYNRKREEQLKINDAVELSGLFKILDMEQNEVDWAKNFFKESVLEERQSIIDEKLSPSENLINLICADMDDLAKAFCDNSITALQVTDFKDEDNILIIKEWLDRAKWLLWIVKYFEVKESKIKKGNSMNPDLANKLSTVLMRTNKDADWFNWYDLVRNYLSKKPQDDAKKNKLKLNFKNSTLMKGWDMNMEKANTSVILRKVDKYYLAIMPKQYNYVFSKIPKLNDNEKYFKKMNYKQIALPTGFGGFVRKCFGSAVKLGWNCPESCKNNDGKIIIKEDEVNINRAEIIDCYKDFLNIYEKDGFQYKEYNFKFKNSNEYESLQKFFIEVEQQGYKITFQDISEKYIYQLIEEGKLHLFEIYSKDFSENKGEKSKNSNLNLQTIYWQHLFDENSTIQLNGGGEMFYRERVELKEEDKAIHLANQPIYRRSDEKKESKFLHDIVKNKRFTTNKFFLHVPIKINYQESSPNQAKINNSVNDNFTQTEDIQFLGIDRGEKHLIYYSLLDSKGNILPNGQGHLDIISNKVNGNEYKKDYLHEINEAAKKRREKQENWQQKGNIANLKDGYISLVVHEIIQKMKDKDGNFIPTFIVMEDLNTGFKRGRQKFEQQVYQKFELALAKKLNYLVDKSKQAGEIGSISNALQLTPLVSNYGDIENRKQVGVLLYTRANYTSVTDPATGWRKIIYLKKGTEAEIKKQILERFSDIGVDAKGDYYFKYTHFFDEEKTIGKEWEFWSGKDGKSLERYRFKRGNSENEPIIEQYNVKDLLDKLFVNFDKSKSLKKQIKEGKELKKVEDEKYKKWTAWEQLRFVIDIIQQIRNSGDKDKGQDDNFLQSPVRDEQGEHYDSRNYRDLENPELPKDADANGAYNIARKGIIMYEHIKHLGENWNKKVKVDGNETIDLDLFVSDKEWDLWLSDKEKWSKELKAFASKEAKENNVVKKAKMKKG